MRAMLKIVVRYGRYVLAALTTVGFGMALN
jgi:hypothetical protein